MKRLLLLLPLCFAIDSVAEPTISTLAGSGAKGYAGDDGSASEAQLDNPFGVIVDPSGDVVFCDTMNHVIRRVSRKSGVIETIVGTGEQGYSGDGGLPLEAKLNEPYEIRFHPSGDLYWVERLSHTVRKLDARTNLVSTVAGTGEPGFSGDGGPGAEARLEQPHSIQFDASGNLLLICDIRNHRIRSVDLATGTIDTWCGTGKPEATPDGATIGSDTPLKGPRALDRGPDGDLWLALREGNQLWRIDAETLTLHHVAGTGKSGFHPEDRPALESELSGPKGVALSPDGMQVYLADTESHTVRAVDLASEPHRLWLVAGTGKKGDGPDSPDPLACGMARLHGIGTDPISGDLHIGDSETHKVRTVAGLPGAMPRQALGTYETIEFEVAGRAARLAKPAEAAAGNPWIWRCRFWGAFPSVDEALLAAGWHVAWIDVAGEFGGPEAMAAFDAFYAKATENGKLHSRPVLEGFSRGGLAAANWAIANPEKVAGLYLDAPVLDIRSWPGSDGGDLWKQALKAHRIDESGIADWKGPLDGIQTLATAQVPVFLVAGGADEVVPFAENGGILETRYRELGGSIESVVKAATGHHPHSLHDPTPVVRWAISLHVK